VASKIAPDAASVSSGCASKAGAKKRLLTRDALDGRTRAARAFDAIASGVISDLGGADQLTTVERELVEAFCGVAVNVRDLNARLLAGEDIDLSEQATAISSMVRLVNHIGVRRRPRDVTPSVAEYVSRLADEDAA
jgi:hypothetical protein